MQLPLAALALGLAGLGYAAAAAADIDAVRPVARDDLALADRANGANGNRPTPSGPCCVADTSLNEDACKAANGQQGRCVPGGNNCKQAALEPLGCISPSWAAYHRALFWCAAAAYVSDPVLGGGALSCVLQSDLGCTNGIQERGKNLCRAKVGNGRYQDGTRVISSLNQARVS